MKRARWSIPTIVVVLSGLCVMPLSCVLNCLLGGCLHAAQAQPAHPANACVTVNGQPAVVATTPATTAPAVASRTKHHCCAVKSAQHDAVAQPERHLRPSVESAATRAANITASETPTPHLGTDGWLTGRVATIADGDQAGCHCCHPEVPERFTVAPVFTVEMPLAPTTSLPVCLPVVRRPADVPPPVVVTHLPSRRETYLRCCVFRI